MSPVPLPGPWKSMFHNLSKCSDWFWVVNGHMWYSTGVLKRSWLYSLCKCTQHQSVLLCYSGTMEIQEKRKIMAVEAPERRMRPAMHRGSISTVLIILHLWAGYPGWHKLFLSPIKPKSTAAWRLLLVCKQDVSENLIIPQSSSLSKHSQNLSLSKNIFADAKELYVSLHPGRCLCLLRTKCNFIWAKLKPLHISLCLHCYTEVCLLLYSWRVLDFSLESCSFVLWDLILMDHVCIWKFYLKNCLRVVVERSTFCKLIFFWHIWQTDCIVLLAISV